MSKFSKGAKSKLCMHECCSYLVGAHDAAEVCELLFHLLDVGDELVDDGGPGLVQGLVPDRGAEAAALK